MMGRVWLSIFCLSWIFQAAGQSKKENDSTTTEVSLEEVVISGNRFGEQKKYIIQHIDVIGQGRIASMNAQNTGDLLMGSGKVFVQKSQQGGSSPVIRGFEASRILLVVDGVRLNNAIYRSGHLQNVITIDQHMLERVEISAGPASTLYGSDALGGSIQLITRNVKLAEDGQKHLTKTGAFVRHSTANRELTIHADWNLSNRKLGWLGSFTFSDFGDMRMGARYRKGFEGFGSRTAYIHTLENPLLDTIVRNPNDRIQRFSGYRQWDLLQKLLWKVNDRISHQLNFQLSGSSDVPRYDRLQDIRNNQLRFATWSYGPQNRLLTAYTLKADKPFGWADAFRLTLSHQGIEESRQTREYRRYDRFDSRRESLNVLGVLMEINKNIGGHTFSAGYDGQWNRLKSVADRTNLLTGIISPLDSRYPDGRNRLSQQGIFLQHVFKSPNGRWALNDGLRQQNGSLQSEIENNAFFNLPVTQFNQRQPALTGNFGLAMMPDQRNRISLGFSSGFRAPNIDDLAKIFESSTFSRQLIIPNSDIRPEHTYSIELGHTYRVGTKFQLEAGVYHTWFKDAIALAPTTLNGADSVMYNGVKCRVFSTQNVNRARVLGTYANLLFRLSSHLTFESSLNWTKGIMYTDPDMMSLVYRKQVDGSYALIKDRVSEKPLDHIPPLFGRTALKYEGENWQVECFSLYNGWKRLDQFNPEGEDNAQYATPKGAPGWCTFNVRGSMKAGRILQIQAAIENITDLNHRYFASGFSAAGRNLSMTLRCAF
jgi:hemoglobin/transferrin/lactoferrin receptor protein